MFTYLGETNEVQSFIPSYIKRVFTLAVKIDGSLKVKRRTLVFTGHGADGSLKERNKEESFF